MEISTRTLIGYKADIKVLMITGTGDTCKDLEPQDTLTDPGDSPQRGRSFGSAVERPFDSWPKSRYWPHATIQQEIQGGEIPFEKLLEIFQKLKVPVDVIHAKCVFKAADHGKCGLIGAEGFKSIYKAFIRRPELLDLFNRLSAGQQILPANNLLDFMRGEQYEVSVSEQNAVELIEKYEPVIEAQRTRSMTFEGFARFLNSADSGIFRRDCARIYQDMRLPLSDYFISTSHNTYLIADQLVGQSHLWGYGSALLRGCRCLEIDCWDGLDGEPVVYHGHTLTSKLLFKTVIYVIEKYAFVASHYPVVLSLENHCSPVQQETMAQHLKSFLGDKLLTMATGNAPDRLPSPEELKFKILIKNKKIGSLQDAALTYGTNKHGRVGEYIEAADDDNDDAEETPWKGQKMTQSLKVKLLNTQKRSKPKPKLEKVTLALELSDLVIYMKSVKFKSFAHSRCHQEFYENNSIAEDVAERLARQSAEEFISHNMKFITRIYPKATRTSSSNPNPQTFWNVGCQMVALNYQTAGTPMDLQDGKFLDNGGCGYVLKPGFLRKEKLAFTLDRPPPNRRPIALSIQIISGFLLPPSSLSVGNTADPVVSVELFGVPADQSKKQTQVTKSNAFNPRWNQPLTFTVHVPELALVRFCVEDQMAFLSNQFLGQYTLPLTCINKGYRNVPLLNKNGQSLVPASLFVHVWYH
ncbi:1-phosphatidylinositol 4,5-bisphosphate phosphodiesterase zeta-1 [Spea bombifrons]|uniref:1-phosphatidylinositol 4,5-bisphosphate phosphodiesterase zeta-1 n=1 Tax=Spea bombifrons TaxID=233779 RepID=UPI00234A6D90|nr:1-phosphatidylinositol 4,5-bisphosphate phosphodiesterase zeta-1 [Spea bombifrons]